MENLAPLLFDFSEDDPEEYCTTIMESSDVMDDIIFRPIVNHLPREIILEILSFFRLENINPVNNESELIKMCFGRFSNDSSIECLFRWIDVDGVAWRKMDKYPQQILHLLQLNNRGAGIELKPVMFRMMEENIVMKDFFFDAGRFDFSLVESLEMNCQQMALDLIQRALQTFTFVKSIEIEMSYSEASLIEIVPFLSNMSNLKSFAFHCDDFVTYDLLELSKVTPQLEELRISSSSSILACHQAVSNWKHLKQLEWAFVSYDNLFSGFDESDNFNEDARLFYEVLNKSLVEHLSLKLEKLTDFFEITSPLLKDLSLKNCTLSPMNYSNILKIEKLERLTLINSHDEIIKQAPYHLKNLKYLCISECDSKSLEYINKIASLQTIDFVSPKFMPNQLYIFNGHPSLDKIIIKGITFKREFFRDLENIEIKLQQH